MDAVFKLYGRLQRTPGWLRWLTLFGWMTAIFVVSHQPRESIPQFGVIDTVVKKVGHAVAYGWLALLACFALAGRPHRFLWALAIAIGYAVTDEFHQSFIDGRNGTVVDVAIDAAGALLTLGLLRRLSAVKSLEL